MCLGGHQIGINKVYGIDISSYKISIVSLYKGEVNVVELISRHKNWEDRFVELLFQFQSFSKSIKKRDIVYIEEPPYVQNIQSYFKLAHFICLCRVILILQGKTFYYVHNSTWKSHFNFPGKIKSEKIKALIKDKAIELFGGEVKNLSQDAADAVLIAKYGYDINYTKEVKN